tara:strand:- start:623 stop:1465 length:843 start_codon:yes stop_codon:yes gene_type:complete
MISNFDDITIVIITYKSEKIIHKFVKKIPINIKTIIIENSKNNELKEKIERNYKNISFFLKNNDGVSSSLNYAVSKISTKYFLQISPDINFTYEDLSLFKKLAEKLDDKFAAIGPRFINVNNKSHKQIKQAKEYDIIDSIHGSCMFINKKCFEEIGGFDDNFFLYFEETDYCYRAKKKGYYSYQINASKVETLGRSIDINKDDKKISNILIWHFIWSKYYFNKKKYGNILTFIIFIPTLMRIIFKISLYKVSGNNKFLKYKFRLDGLLKSISNQKSNLRP